MSSKKDLGAPVRLSSPQISASLLQIMNNRVSTKEYCSSRLDEQDISNILWVAFGKNKKGTRTIPTALNEKNLKIFILNEKGIWLYDGENHTLNKISNENALSSLALQDYVRNGSLNLVYTGSNPEYSLLHAGAAYQNVYLYVTEKGLGTVVRGFIDKEKLHQALGLREDEFVIIHQLIGYPDKKD